MKLLEDGVFTRGKHAMSGRTLDEGFWQGGISWIT